MLSMTQEMPCTDFDAGADVVCCVRADMRVTFHWGYAVRVPAILWPVARFCDKMSQMADHAQKAFRQPAFFCL